MSYGNLSGYRFRDIFQNLHRFRLFTSFGSGWRDSVQTKGMFTEERVMAPMVLKNHEIPLGDGHKLWTEMLVGFQYRLDNFQEDESEYWTEKQKRQVCRTSYDVEQSLLQIARRWRFNPFPRFLLIVLLRWFSSAAFPQVNNDSFCQLHSSDSPSCLMLAKLLVACSWNLESQFYIWQQVW